MPGENPLFNPIVLDTIMKEGNLSVSDLKSVRLVCKDWFNMSLPTWRRTALLRVSYGGRRTRGVSSFTKFTKALDDPEKVAFYQLDRYPFKQVRFTRCDLSLNALWEKIGCSTLQYLHLYQCRYVEPNMAADLVVAKIVFEKCPKLKFLKLTNNAKFPKGTFDLFNLIKKDQLKSEQEGFQPHQCLENVLINQGIPEKLMILLPLAVNLKSVVILHGESSSYQIVARERDAGTSKPSTLGQRVLDVLFERDDFSDVTLPLVFAYGMEIVDFVW